jgi:hypothetical protein
MRHNILIISVALVASSIAFGQRNRARSPEPEQEEVVIAAEDEFRKAKLKNDVAALERILGENFHEIDQNRNARNKKESIDFFRGSPITNSNMDAAQVRLTANTAIVTGVQTEQNTSGTERLLFMRVWIKQTGRWRLIGSMQYRDPKE